MTFRSLRNRRTTRSSTPRTNNARGRMLVVLSCAGLLVLAGLRVASSADEESDPISRLGKRSADERWSEARREWLPFGALRRQRRMERQNASQLSQPPMAPPIGSLETPESEQAASRRARGGRHNKQDRPESDGFASAESSRAMPSDDKAVVAQPNRTRATNTSLSKVRESAASDPAPNTANVPREFPSPAASPESDGFPTVQIVGRPLSAGDLGSIATRDAESHSPDSVEENLPAPPRQFDIAQEPLLNVPEPSPATEPTPVADSPADLPVQKEGQLVMPPEPLTNAPLQLRKISEIQPFRNYSAGSAVTTICPPPLDLPADATPPRCPEEEELPLFGSLERDFINIQYCWEASNLFHNPLYFADFPLERYGHTYPKVIQPFVSVGKFGAQLVGLPYQIALNDPHAKVYPLGYYRPGECAPYKCYQVPLSAHAALGSAAVYTGFAFLFP